MRVVWVSLTTFRSYHRAEWAPESGVNILVGSNGAGKTNMLESIGYLSTLRSFRGVPDGELITDTSDTAVIRAGVHQEGRDRLVEIQLNRGRARTVQVDKNRPARASEMLGVVRVVTFLPDDLDMVKRGPANRRDLLDEVAVQLWPASQADQSEYERALRQRNAFLKSGDRDDSTLSVWDSRLAQAGGRVLARRARVLEELGTRLSSAYQEISRSDSRALIEYRTSWGGSLEGRSGAELGAEMATAVQRARTVDFERRLTTVGPHRDDPVFLLDGAEARTHASQGEQRSLALSVKLAAHRAVSDTFDEHPILLLDDVFSELDGGRSEALSKALPSDTQTIITTARPEDVPVSGRQWLVEDGEIR